MHLDALLLAASERLAKPFSLIVHLGAGSGAPDLYASVPCARLVLVEGEPAVADELRARCAARLPAAEVEQVVIAPSSGPVTWHQYNLRPLSGPANAMEFRSWYPRLEQTGSRQAQAIGISEWLASVIRSEARRDGGREADAASSLLVLDMPGQETGLVDALKVVGLRRFGWIIVRRWHRSGEAPGADAVHRSLAQAGFDRVIPGTEHAEAQLTQELYRFDERQEQLQQLKQEHDDMRARMCELEQALEASRESLRVAEERLGESEANLHDSRAREARLTSDIDALTTRQREMMAAGERSAGLAAEAQARAAQLDTERAELRRLCDTLRAELRAAQTGAERAAQAARETEARAVQLDAERTELRKASGDLRDKLKVAEASVAELGRRHQEAEASATSRSRELEAATKQLADERRDGRTKAQRIETLEAELLSVQFRFETLQQELIKAEGQLEVLKDLLLTDTTL